MGLKAFLSSIAGSNKEILEESFERGRTGYTRLVFADNPELQKLCDDAYAQGQRVAPPGVKKPRGGKTLTAGS